MVSYRFSALFTEKKFLILVFFLFLFLFFFIVF